MWKTRGILCKGVLRSCIQNASNTLELVHAAGAMRTRKIGGRKVSGGKA